MTDLPDPLTPPECDLHDYPWMPLDVRRLLTSETWILGTPDQKCAAMTLWCESWQQIPAGSLPDNDRMLAHLSQAGAAWRKVREHVLRSWIKCSDGRLYHPVVAEKARESWAMKLAQKARTEAARRAKQERKAATEPPQNPPHAHVTESVTEPVTCRVAISVTDVVTGSTGQDRTGQEKERKEERTPSHPSGGRSPTPAAAHGSRLPPDWQPEPPEREFAASLGLDPGATALKFRDFWHSKPGKDGRKCDWAATWRNWCRRDAEAAKNHRNPPVLRDKHAELLAVMGLDGEPVTMPLGLLQ